MNWKRLKRYWKDLRVRVQQGMNLRREPKQCKSKEITRYIIMITWSLVFT